MQITHDDVQWLKQLRAGTGTGLPAFNKSRLIAMCLLEVAGGRLVLTPTANAVLKRD